jgi:hypothetical protein
MATIERRFALIVPYRNRQHNVVHLILHLLWYLDPYSFDIIVVEQADSLLFNRGSLLNAGFRMARARHEYSHYAFHDVDLIPQQADYSFPQCPTHLSAAVGQFLYEIPYQHCFGGVVLFNQDDFETVNGFSNNYWGWGREDYDLYCRCERAGLRIERRAGRFISLPHSVDPGLEVVWAKNKERFDILQQRDFREDGLSSLDYDLVKSGEIAELPFVDVSRKLTRPVLWSSVKLKGGDILTDQKTTNTVTKASV